MYNIYNSIVNIKLSYICDLFTQGATEELLKQFDEFYRLINIADEGVGWVTFLLVCIVACAYRGSLITF